jgi:chaperonin cofactor prefoldin
LHDLTNLLYIIASFLTGFFTFRLNDKKTSHDILSDDNDRLEKEIKRLNAQLISKDKKIDELRKELSNAKHTSN